jgi:dUTP pyrophosphatase
MAQEKLKVKIKRLMPEAIIPKYAKAGDAGLDLVATSHAYEQNESGRRMQVYGTGLAFEIPAGYVGLIYPRSSISKTCLSLTNSVGVIDSGYRGEVLFKFAIDDSSRASIGGTYKIGDRIGQLVIVPYPSIEFEESDNLSDTERGSGGYGSSGV